LRELDGAALVRGHVMFLDELEEFLVDGAGCAGVKDENFFERHIF
jgi:hypothetical protein